MKRRVEGARRMPAFMLAVCATLALAAAGAPASAARGIPLVTAGGLTAGSRYLALGDSVTFGYEEPQVVPAPDYNNASSFLGYPEQIVSELHVNVANAACPGETSSSLINASAVSNGCENVLGNTHVGYRTLHPLHVRYRGSQLAFALAYLRSHRNVRLVSLMIGANDYFVCVETTADGCASSSERSAVLAKIAGNVRLILSAIRSQARYRGQLAIVNYYSLNYASAAVNAQSITLNETQDGAARPFHVVIADGYDQFRLGAIHSGGSDCAAGLITQLGSPLKCGIHPSYAGQALLAQALVSAIRL